MNRYLVTSALPYANGPIHFGHVVGAYLPADVYVRALRRQGEDALFICGTDEHGVAITIGADKNGQEYSEYVEGWHKEIEKTLTTFGIEFDIFSGTSTCPQHAEFSLEFFKRLRERGYLQKQTSEQLYCNQCELFLADRYVLGGCPECGHESARGDECPACGSWLDPLKLVSPSCRVCTNAPEKRETTHFFLDLPKLRDEAVGAWFGEKTWKPNVDAFVRKLLEDVHARPITRDMKWGVELPSDLVDGEEGKVLYVWFDAPIGYISMSAEWSAANGDPDGWKDWWQNKDTRLVHFIGKDNIPFHTLVFPSMLHGVGQDYILPWRVPANEFYNLEGGKFSTSEGWTIPLDEFFERYDPEVARFHLIASMPETSDSEWNWKEFQATANAGLADTIGNLVTRVLRFLDKHFDGVVPPVDESHRARLEGLLLEECGVIGDPAEHITAFRFRKAAEQLLLNAAVANVFIDRTAPWKLRKTDMVEAGSVLGACCQYLGWLAHWMTPMLPGKAQALWEMLGQSGEVAELPWPGTPCAETWQLIPAGQKLGEVAGLFDKLEDAQIEAEIASLKTRALASSDEL
jgi:methionyl-tRNA synthetase